MASRTGRCGDAATKAVPTQAIAVSSTGSLDGRSPNPPSTSGTFGNGASLTAVHASDNAASHRGSATIRSSHEDRRELLSLSLIRAVVGVAEPRSPGTDHPPVEDLRSAGSSRSGFRLAEQVFGGQSRVVAGRRRAEPGVLEESAEGGRVLALSDGVFAIAATLLALDLRVPPDLDSAGLRGALRALVPSLIGYTVAFLVIGLLWLGHHQLFSALRRVSGAVARTNIVLLGLVALLPFPSSMLADYGQEPVAVIIYAGNVGSIALVQMGIVGIALRERAFRFRLSGPQVFAPSAVTAAVFFLSMPLALISPMWASLSWLLLIPAHAAAHRFQKRGLVW